MYPVCLLVPVDADVQSLVLEEKSHLKTIRHFNLCLHSFIAFYFFI